MTHQRGALKESRRLWPLAQQGVPTRGPRALLGTLESRVSCCSDVAMTVGSRWPWGLLTRECELRGTCPCPWSPDTCRRRSSASGRGAKVRQHLSSLFCCLFSEAPAPADEYLGAFGVTPPVCCPHPLVAWAVLCTDHCGVCRNLYK